MVCRRFLSTALLCAAALLLCSRRPPQPSAQARPCSTFASMAAAAFRPSRRSGCWNGSSSTSSGCGRVVSTTSSGCLLVTLSAVMHCLATGTICSRPKRWFKACRLGFGRDTTCDTSVAWCMSTDGGRRSLPRARWSKPPAFTYDLRLPWTGPPA